MDNASSQSRTITSSGARADKTFIWVHHFSRHTETHAIQEGIAQDDPLLLFSRPSRPSRPSTKYTSPSSLTSELIESPTDGDRRNIDDGMIIDQEDATLTDSAGGRSIPISIEATMADGDLHIAQKEDYVMVPSQSTAPSVLSVVFVPAPGPSTRCT